MHFSIRELFYTPCNIPRVQPRVTRPGICLQTTWRGMIEQAQRGEKDIFNEKHCSCGRALSECLTTQFIRFRRCWKSTCKDCISAQDIFFYQLDKITLFRLKSPILRQTKFWRAEKYNLNLALFYCQLSAQIEGGWQQFAALSTTYILMGHHNNLSVNAKIMVSIGCPIIGEHIVIIFMTK